MRLGIDLGGTKIEIIALDHSGNEVYRQRIATPQGDYAATLDAVVQLVEKCETNLGRKGSLGVGIPGALSNTTGLVKNANSICLIGQDLKGDLQRRLHREVFVANDANCFALSEAVDGSAKGAKVVFGVIIGTGCGGSVVVDGQTLNGVNLVAGEWGHNPLPWSCAEQHFSCYCGHKGCIETFLSGSAFEKHFQLRSGQSLNAEQIVALAEQGNPLAEAMLQDYVVWMAKALASVINLVDPDVIVLGGGMSNIHRLYEEVPKIWEQWVFTDEPVLTQLLPPAFGDSSGVRGAAWLANTVLADNK
ncbi:ROK family protein [Thiomicrorhabdus xiamenensis]|uniref:ROK family protein n=1 Tax=Thiomicrorhabdus xiamenensis TaxID=2739063 RepID=A0A7D4TA40_9GAMM|nr:ROK family protein [Thiomicrorhabdus xiamenensis]QKI88986.1 ROK family protein [Thiomicrorhabdus xiamenensis]